MRNTTRRLITRLGVFARGRDRRRETMAALASNREAEAGLWDRAAREGPPGPARKKAIRKRDERAAEARRLRGLDLEDGAAVMGGR